MKTIEKWMIKEIKFYLDHSDIAGASKFYNTMVESCYSGIRWTAGYDSWIEVNLNGELIAAIYPFTSRLVIGNADGIMNRSRINAILRELAPHMRVEKRKEGIVVVDSHRMWSSPDIQPLTDNWYTRYSIAA